MDNEMSFESLYMKGFGLKADNKSVSYSGEPYITDGFEEGAAIELAQATENLKFLDAYTSIARKNASDKIRMCKKLAVNYGMKSGVNTTAAKSIESLCKIQSIEAEEAAEEAGVDTSSDNKVPDNKKPTLGEEFKQNKRDKGFWKALWAAIVRIAKAVANFFRELLTKIRNWFAKKFGKKHDDVPKENQAAVKEELKKLASETESEMVLLEGTVDKSAVQKTEANLNEACKQAETVLNKVENSQPVSEQELKKLENALINLPGSGSNGSQEMDEVFFKSITGFNPTKDVNKAAEVICSGSNLDNMANAVKDSVSNGLAKTAEVESEKLAKKVENIEKSEKVENIEKSEKVENIEKSEKLKASKELMRASNKENDLNYIGTLIKTLIRCMSNYPNVYKKMLITLKNYAGINEKYIKKAEADHDKAIAKYEAAAKNEQNAKN